MTFTSLSTIIASLAITAAVFISTWFPAMSAMRIAAPADDAGWKLPQPDGNEMMLTLPFTFDRRDRIAVLAFFNRYFLDRGEGSAGRFFAATPMFGVDEDRAVPMISTTVWLRPFDLGVSQELTICVPEDPQTREYIATLRLRRISGTRESWLRLNHGFVSEMRRHFLHWRRSKTTSGKSCLRKRRRNWWHNSEARNSKSVPNPKDETRNLKF